MDWECESTTCTYEVSPDFARSARDFREVVRPAEYVYVCAAPWRVAVPMATNTGGWPQVGALLATIRAHGPAAAGYVQVGSTLVPASLSPGGRLALANYALPQ